VYTLSRIKVRGLVAAGAVAVFAFPLGATCWKIVTSTIDLPFNCNESNNGHPCNVCPDDPFPAMVPGGDCLVVESVVSTARDCSCFAGRTTWNTDSLGNSWYDCAPYVLPAVPSTVHRAQLRCVTYCFTMPPGDPSL